MLSLEEFVVMFLVHISEGWLIPVRCQKMQIQICYTHIKGHFTFVLFHLCLSNIMYEDLADDKREIRVRVLALQIASHVMEYLFTGSLKLVEEQITFVSD